MSQNAAKRGDMIARYTMYIRALSASVARNWHLADDHVTSFHLIHIHHDNIIISRFNGLEIGGHFLRLSVSRIPR